MCDDLTAVQPTRHQTSEHVTRAFGTKHLHSESGSRNIVQKHLKQKHTNEAECQNTTTVMTNRRDRVVGSGVLELTDENVGADWIS